MQLVLDTVSSQKGTILLYLY